MGESIKLHFLSKTIKEIKDSSFLVDDEEMLDEALERLNELKCLLKKSISTELNIPLEQQEARYHEHEPKSKRLWDLILWKKKGKFSGKHGETAERFMAAKTIKANTLHYAPIEKA